MTAHTRRIKKSRVTLMSALCLTGALYLTGALCSELYALSVKPMSLSALTKRAPLIVYGRVISQEVTQRPRPQGRPWIFTLSVVEVQECWRAQAACPKQLIVSQIGGSLTSSTASEPPLTLAIPGLPTLRLGDEAGLFLTPKLDPPPSALPMFVIVGGAQGARVAQEGDALTDLRQEVLTLTTEEDPTAGSIAPKP